MATQLDQHAVRSRTYACTLGICEEVYGRGSQDSKKDVGKTEREKDDGQPHCPSDSHVISHDGAVLRDAGQQVQPSFPRSTVTLVIRGLRS